jgi:F-type H+-transporting ATPase subunit delta
MYEYLDRRYALAIYKIAEEKGKVKEYLEELRQIVKLIKADPKLLEIIEHPEVSTTAKEKIFTDIFKGRIDEDIFSFLMILIKKDRIMDIENALKEFENIYLEKNNTVVAKVKTVVPLKADEEKSLVEKLEKKFNKKVLIRSELDPSIIGGVYVNINNEVIDGTIKSKLSEMKKIMLKRD